MQPAEPVQPAMAQRKRLIDSRYVARTQMQLGGPQVLLESPEMDRLWDRNHVRLVQTPAQRNLRRSRIKFAR